ncbi:DNA-directed RNA polymerase III, subunit Rpc31 [Gongronella butleri]|nr:DNA-directed RNA polymerase III, subunit Rpc31 [Gongronella butleri]
MSRGGFGRGGGGGAKTGASALISFDLLRDGGLNSLFKEQSEIFPQIEVPVPRKPAPTEHDRWLARKSYLDSVRNSPFLLAVPPPPKDIERYSDKYRVPKRKRLLRDIRTDLDMFPEELQSIVAPSKAKKSKIKPKKKINDARRDRVAQLAFVVSFVERTAQTQDAFGQIEALLASANDEKDDEKDEDKAPGSDVELDDEENFDDEEDMIDDNDYGQNYFDNGEDDDVDDDDGDADYY